MEPRDIAKRVESRVLEEASRLRAAAAPKGPEGLLGVLRGLPAAQQGRSRVLGYLERAVGGDAVGLLEEAAVMVCGEAMLRLRAVVSCADPGRAGFLERSGGVLSSLPLLVKDTVDHVGFPTTLGTGYYVYRASATAELVSALEAAGAVVLGKTVPHELALGTTGVNNALGTPVNPRCPGRIPGGSSSGSAVAVAAGAVPLAIGHDAGGSVRIPAAMVGVVGFKTSTGYASDRGMYPRVQGLSAPGFFAETVVDVIAGLEAVRPGAAERVKAVYGELREPLILAPTDVVASAEEAVREAFYKTLDALKEAGWRVREERLGLPEWLDRARALVTLVDAYREYRGLYEAYRDRMGEDVKFLLELGKNFTLEGYDAARLLLEKARAVLRSRLVAYDAVVTPTVPVEPPRLEEADWRLSAGTRLLEYTGVWNALDLPAVSIPGPARYPCGGPAGLQLVSVHGDEYLAALALRAEEAFRGENTVGGAEV